MTVWRMVKARWAATAFDGEGSRKFGGRWNPVGISMVYASESRSLAAFENLVHTQNANLLTEFVMIPATFDREHLITWEAATLPEHWGRPQIGGGTQEMGRVWARSNASISVRVPSMVIPGEWNFLLNPKHPEFAAAVDIGEPQSFTFDARVME